MSRRWSPVMVSSTLSPSNTSRSRCLSRRWQQSRISSTHSSGADGSGSAEIAAIALSIARDRGESRDQHSADSWGVKASSCPCNHPTNVPRKPRQSRACPLLNSQSGIPQPPSFFGRGVFSGTGKLSRKSRGDAPNPLVTEGSIPSGIAF